MGLLVKTFSTPSVCRPIFQQVHCSSHLQYEPGWITSQIYFSSIIRPFLVQSSQELLVWIITVTLKSIAGKVVQGYPKDQENVYVLSGGMKSSVGLTSTHFDPIWPDEPREIYGLEINKRKLFMDICNAFHRFPDRRGVWMGAPKIRFRTLTCMDCKAKHTARDNIQNIENLAPLFTLQPCSHDWVRFKMTGGTLDWNFTGDIKAGMGRFLICRSDPTTHQNS